MNYQEVIGIVALVLEIAVLIIALYFRSKGNVIEIVSQLIAIAEQTGMPGPDKMAMVVEEMYTRLPAPFRAVLNKEKLQIIAQYVFDWMKTYALEYLESKKKKDQIEEPPAEYDEEVDEIFDEPQDVIPEICEECVEDACPITTEDQN